MFHILKLLKIVASRGEIFSPKFTKIPFGGRAPPGPAEGAKALPRPLSAERGPTSKGRGRRGEKGKGEF